VTEVTDTARPPGYPDRILFEPEDAMPSAVPAVLSLSLLVLTAPVAAQTPPGAHSHHHAGPPPDGAPAQAGQDAFGAIAEVVRLLQADPATDWSRVDIERLRQHLIDMNEVVLRAAVAARPVPGGLAMDVTGGGRTERAIRAMVVPHAAELDRMAEWTARTAPIPGGIRLTVTARADDPQTVARIRGLGFAGLLVQGGHHGPHHLEMARGTRPAHRP
jgi:hypothetical protein